MNSSRHRSAFRNWSEYAAVRLLLFVLAATPRELALRLAQGMTKLLDVLVPRLRRTGLENLAFALPHLTAQQHNAILDGVFRSIARLLVSFSRFPSLNSANIGEWISCQGFEHYADGLKLGHGVLFYTAHLGNWELSAFAHALLARPMHVVVRPLDNPLIDALAARYRSASGNHLIGKKEARPILKALAANQAVGILADQDAGIEEGVFVDFFGRQASAHPGFARVAAHSRAAVVPGFALWSEKEARYILKFYPPVEMTGDAVADTQRLHSHLETVIRQCPDQWLWIHRRWKTQPPLPRLTVE
ncbi:MAG TPA: lysophospholipid acyltransferase family protein [Bryobacteraceae bacterium]|nr:lysophospholipid acyltransferase family protein [Bryobacteraceae bacterium]